jgi:hypothetical protein
VEGARKYLPLAIPLEPEKKCYLNEEQAELKCSSFLIIYIRTLSYGRSFSSAKELCDGEKLDDTAAPEKDCFDEEGKVMTIVKASCHGTATCDNKIPSLPLDASCNGLKRELRMEYVCVACYQWFSYIEDEKCLDHSLQQNFWASEEDLKELIDAEKKNILMTNLNRWFDGEIHTLIDLSIRDVSADKGSLCGMAAIYQALENTVLTKSELKKLTYDDGRVRIAEEMKQDPKKAKKMTDVQILTDYHKCE